MGTNAQDKKVEEINSAMMKYNNIQIDDRKNFYHYTSLDKARLILNNGNSSYFFMSKLCDTNDQDEINLHKTANEKIYILSFSNSDAKKEDIPLWYLYGGILGDGIKIGFSSKELLEIINNMDTVFEVKNDQVTKRKYEFKRNDYEVECGWIWYINGNEAKYKNKEYKIIDFSDKNDFVHNYFIKNYDWNYEKEFRIIVKMKKEVPEKIAIEIPKNKNGVVDCSIITGPNKNDENNCKNISEILNISENNVSHHTLHMKMNLLEKNKKSIINNIEKIIDNSSNGKNLLCEHMKEKGLFVQCKDDKMSTTNL